MKTRLARAWFRDRGGVAAIEFSMLAVPFMLMVVGIIEMALLFLSGTLLEGGVASGARLIKTGQLQAMPGGQDAQVAAFLNEVCRTAGFVMNCNAFQYQIIKLDSFNDAAPPVVDEDGNLAQPAQYEDIDAGCIAVVRVSYLYPIYTPFFGSIFSNYPNNRRLLLSTTVFQTEPFEFNSGVNC